MASEKAAKILWKLEAPFTPEQVAAMPEAQAWAWIRPRERKLSEMKARMKLPQICFTGFKNSQKEKLRQLATQIGFDVKDGMTKNLAILVIGENAGPSKISKATAQGCTILTEGGFIDYFRSKKNE